MNRREFLKITALGTVGITLPTLTSCNNNVKSDAPVIIIGAGMAGLGAARALQNTGFTNVIVLEGRNRIGGRIWTDRSMGFPLDLGASWIHGPKGGNPISALAESANAKTFMTDDEKLKVYNTNGSVIGDDVMDTYYKDYNRMNNQLENSGQEGQTYRQAVQEYNAGYLTDNIMKYQLSAYAEFDAGGPIEEMDAKNWQNDEKFPGKDVLFPDGYDAVVKLLAEGLNIRLNTTVTQINYAGADTVISTNQGSFTAKYVVCTLPLGVLKAGNVTFTPTLPADKQGAISRMKMGYVNKVGLEFPSVFWDNEQQYLGYCSDTKGQYAYFINCRKFVEKNVLMTFGFGNYGQTMENESDNKIGSDIMDILRKMYGNAIPNYSQIKVSRWSQDQFARGAYSFANVGASSADFDAFTSAVNDRIFFAGEHTIGKYRGTVHGAYISGLKQAERIVDLEDK